MNHNSGFLGVLPCFGVMTTLIFAGSFYYDVPFATFMHYTSPVPPYVKWFIIVIGVFASIVYFIDFAALQAYFFKPNPLLTNKKQWLPACEKTINDFLNAKYTVTLDIDASTERGGMFDIDVLIDDVKRGSACLGIRNVDPANERSTRIIADYFINDYNAKREHSILFRALHDHDVFVTAEKKLRKPARAIRNLPDTKQ